MRWNGCGRVSFAPHRSLRMRGRIRIRKMGRFDSIGEGGWNNRWDGSSGSRWMRRSRWSRNRRIDARWTVETAIGWTTRRVADEITGTTRRSSGWRRRRGKAHRGRRRGTRGNGIGIGRRGRRRRRRRRRSRWWCRCCCRCCCWSWIQWRGRGLWFLPLFENVGYGSGLWSGLWSGLRLCGGCGSCWNGIWLRWISLPSSFRSAPDGVHFRTHTNERESNQTKKSKGKGKTKEKEKEKDNEKVFEKIWISSPIASGIQIDESIRRETERVDKNPAMMGSIAGQEQRRGKACRRVRTSERRRIEWQCDLIDTRTKIDCQCSVTSKSAMRMQNTNSPSQTMSCLPSAWCLPQCPVTPVTPVNGSDHSFPSHLIAMLFVHFKQTSAN